jgi:hypothetical protein
MEHMHMGAKLNFRLKLTLFRLYLFCISICKLNFELIFFGVVHIVCVLCTSSDFFKD